MEDKKREKLEELLRAVQDTKSEFYVGTQEAYRAVKRISSEIYENPGKTAVGINHALKQRFTRPSYEATPERIYGTSEVLSDALDTDELYRDEPDNTSFLFTFDHQETLENVGNLSEIKMRSDFRMQPSDLSRIMTPYFIRANKRGVSNNADFGKVVVDYLREGLRDYSDNIDPMSIPDYLEWTTRFLNILHRTDWNEELSKETFNRILTRHRGGILVNELSLSNIVDRLINDRYNHRLEYRRQVLSRWLEGRESYEEAVKTAEFMIESKRERCRIFEVLNIPQEIIEGVKKSIQLARYIRHVLESEKNFVKRYLEE